MNDDYIIFSCKFPFFSLKVIVNQLIETEEKKCGRIVLKSSRNLNFPVYSHIENYHS
jgi:hypothetical protein